MSNISIEHEKNYAAQVIEIPELVKAPNSDRLFIANVLGYSIIVDDSWKDREGDLAVFFPAESQVSEGLAEFANLYSSQDLNRVKTEKGYLAKNRRVRAIKLRGNISSALLLPVHVVEMYAEFSLGLVEGDVFDTFNGKEICRKYVLPVKAMHQTPAQKRLKAAFKRVDEKMFPMHIDTGHWLREEYMVSPDDVLIVTQKLHGSSVRFGNVPVKVKPKWHEKLASKLGLRIRETEYDTVGGSRKVIKDPNNPNQAHYYGEGNDIWSLTLEKYGKLIPEGFIVYGELIGYTPDGYPIQKGYTYMRPQGRMDLFVYRVAVVTPGGSIVDLSWGQVKKFCVERGLAHVPELWRGFKRDFILSDFEERNFYEDDFLYTTDDYTLDTPIPVGKKKGLKDEGIVIRVDRGDLVPGLFKFKNQSFLVAETAELDEREESGEEAIEA